MRWASFSRFVLRYRRFAGFASTSIGIRLDTLIPYCWSSEIYCGLFVIRCTLRTPRIFSIAAANS